MATTIKSTRVVKTYEYKSNDYNISGDFVVSELGNVVSVSGNIIKGNAQVGNFNAYDYNDTGSLSVNVTGVDVDNIIETVTICHQFIDEIKPKVESDAQQDLEPTNEPVIESEQPQEPEQDTEESEPEQEPEQEEQPEETEEPGNESADAEVAETV